MLIKLTHNMEIAHRLFLMPGKCQQIHGHSMQVNVTLHGSANEFGIFEGLDFGDVKKAIRKHIDETYDHKLLLNKDDPWAGELGFRGTTSYLPGLVALPGDPTTENLAMWIGEWMRDHFQLTGRVYIQETGTNGVGVAFG